MKRIFATLCILSCLLLSACGESTSIGMIGGSDGPTSIFVSHENGDTVKKPIRMIKADGKLYYDSGRLSEITARCGNLDGELKQTCAEYEIPKEDYGCNFGGAKGYQNVSNITKEVLVNNEWVIFKLFEDAEQDMSVFKYCFYLKGHLPNAAKDSEFVVLTEDIEYDFEAHSKLFRQNKFTDEPDKENFQTTFRVYGDNDKWGISLGAKDVTNTGLTMTIEQFGGSPTGDLQTGTAFSLEVLDNGRWQPVDAEKLDVAWTSIAYRISKNDITELRQDWKLLYGELPPGFYKLKKEITDFRATGDYDMEWYELYFTIYDV